MTNGLALIAFLALTPLAVLAAVTVSLSVWGYKRIPSGRPVRAYPGAGRWRSLTKAPALSAYSGSILVMLAVAAASGPTVRLVLIAFALAVVGMQYRAVRAALRPGPGALSPREHDALRLILDGKDYPEIAEHLSVTEAQARSIVHDIVRHLGARDAGDAAQQLVESGLLTQP